MKKAILLLVIVCLSSCDNKKKEPEPEQIEVIDVTPRKSNGDPIDTYRDRDGVRWSKYNIFAPKENESLNDPKFRRKINTGNQYGEAYEQGCEDARNGNVYDDSGGNGQYRKGYEDGFEAGG
jgi:hypothetical protein